MCGDQRPNTELWVIQLTPQASPLPAGWKRSSRPGCGRLFHVRLSSACKSVWRRHFALAAGSVGGGGLTCGPLLLTSGPPRRH